MGRFANTLFIGLLGWTRSLFSSVWAAITGTGNNNLPNWFSKNWITVTVILCLIGLITDLIVYLLRWRPYRVWRSQLIKFQKIKNPEENGYTDSFEEERYEEELNNSESQENEYSESVTPNTSDLNEKDARTSWHWREDPLNQNGEARTLMNDSGYRGYRSEDNTVTSSVSDRTSRFEQAIRPRRRRATVARFFREGEEELEYTAPQELIDRREAYRRPVYPRNWKRNAENESEDQES